MLWRRLRAGKHGLAKEGITYAGLSFDGSTDGTARGKREEEEVKCWWVHASSSAASRLEFAVVVPPLSAVILRVE
eukprot:COSAG06_NODE_2236_length_7275_cov_86.121656_5_plen_75_part_00